MSLAADTDLRLQVLRFADASTERDYQRWRVLFNLWQVRLGHICSILAWAGGMISFQLLIPDFMARHPGMVWFNWMIVIPIFVLGVAATLYAPWHRWVLLSSASANVVAGLAIVWEFHRFFGAPGLAVCGAIIIAMFGAAVYRIPPRWAALMFAPYTLLALVLNVGLWRDGSMSLWVFHGYNVFLFFTVFLAVLVNTFLERSTRITFRNECIIERQTRALEEERAQISRFLSPEVAGMIHDKGIEETLKQQTLELTAVCCDLRGFTHYTETNGAEKMGAVLREYYAKIVEVAKRHGGTVKDFAGDGALILIGAPAPRADHATAGVALARELVAEVRPIVGNHSMPETPLGIGAGVASGLCAVGAIGSQSRLEYTAVGSPVNLASRLCSEAKDGEVLVDAMTAAAAGVGGEARPLAIKGFEEPLDVVTERVAG